MSDGKESHSVYSSAPLSPMRSEEFDYQQSNITLLKVLSDSQPSLYQGINNCETISHQWCVGTAETGHS